MTNSTGTVPLDELLSQLPAGHVGRQVGMRATKEHKKGDDWFRVDNAHVENDAESSDPAKVYIFDEIGMWGTNAQDFIKLVLQIDKDQIELHLNSPGGSMFDGVAIYNALKMHKADVSVYVDGLAASAASFIAQAGDSIIMTEAATMMIHDASALAYDNADGMRKTADILDKLSNNIANIYSSRAGGTSDEWRAFMREETWYNAQEAVDAGLADQVGGTSDDVKNAWDLSIFNYAGRDEAPSPLEVKNKVNQVINKVKETSVTAKQPKNSTEGEVVPETPPTTPETPPVEPETPPAEGDEPPVAPVTEPQNKLVGPVTVRFADGTSSSDPQVIQSRITAMETAQHEVQVNNRKAFVASLASGPQPKVLASQMSQLEEFALELSPEMYEKWTASWDAVPVSSVLQPPSVVPPAGDGSVTQAQDRIEVLKGTIKNHKDGGMRPEQIMQTQSYKDLIALQPDFKL